MPVRYELDESLLRIEAVGEYVPSDIIRAFLQALDDPHCPPRVALLLDTTRSKSLGRRSPEQVGSVAEFIGPHLARLDGRCAVVAESDLHFALSRMGSALSERAGIETQVFRTEPPALRWLREDATARKSDA